MTWLSWLTVGFLAIAIAGFAVAGYWQHGAGLYLRAAAAYRRDDIPEGDRLRKRAERWNIGARGE